MRDLCTFSCIMWVSRMFPCNYLIDYLIVVLIIINYKSKIIRFLWGKARAIEKVHDNIDRYKLQGFPLTPSYSYELTVIR